MIEKRSIQTEEKENKSSLKWLLILLITLLTGGATYTGLAFTVLIPKYTISFETNGGSIEEPIKFDGKSSIILPSSTKVGYKLQGWYLDNEDYVNKVENDYFIEHNISSNTTLYAKWNLGTYTSSDGTIEYENNGTSVSLTHVIDDSATEVVIPSVIDSLPVNDIGEDAFKDNTKLQKVTIEPGLTYIKANAFKGCTSLVEITIPDTVIYIGDYAFENTSLSNLVIPNSVRGMGVGVFQNNSLLQNISMSTEVNQFGNALFNNCPKLTTINYVISAITPAASSEGADLYSNLTKIGDNVFKDDIALVYFNIPVGVEEIGDNAFENIGATSIVIPNTVTKLGKSLFTGSSSLVSVTLPTSLTTISEKMFLNCTSLTTINNSSTISGPSLDLSIDSSELTIPDGIVSIGRNAFEGCSGIQIIKMSNSVTRIEPYAFSNCALLSDIQLSNKLDTIEEYLFANDTSITSFTIPSTIKLIRDHAFSKTRITDLVIPSTGSIMIINGGLAGLDNLVSLSSPFIGMSKGVGDSAYIGWFFGAETYESNNEYLPTNLTSFTLTSNETIGHHAFYGSTHLQTVNIGSSEKIDEYAFKGCTSLSTVDLKGVKHIGKGILQDTYINGLTLDFIGSGSGKENWFGWIFGSDSKESNNDYIPSTLHEIDFEGTTIGDYAFYGLSKDITLNCKNILDSIGAYSFASNTELTSIPVITKVIGNYAFFNCGKLSQVDDLSYTETIGEYAFQNCTSLNVVALDNIKEIGKYAFKGSSIDTISLSSSLTEIKEGTFENSLITDVISTATNISIGKYAFREASKLATLGGTFLSKVTTIGESAFENCPKLLTIVFPDSGNRLTKVDSYAFSNCSYIYWISLPSTINEIGIEILKGSNALLSLSVPFIGQYPNNETNKRFSWLYNAEPSDEELITNLLNLSVTNDTIVATDSFKNVKIKEVTYTANLTTIKQGGFQETLIETIVLPTSLSIIDTGAFQNNNYLKNVSIPNPYAVGKADGYLFYNCPLIADIISFTSNKSIPAYAYAKTGVKNVIFNDSIKQLGEGVFSDCTSLATISYSGNSITQISNKAFKGCTALTELTIGQNNLTSIDSYAFEGCTSLTLFDIYNTNVRFGSAVLKDCSKLATLRVQTLGSDVDNHSNGYLSRFFGDSDKTVKEDNLVPLSLKSVNLYNRNTLPTYAFAFAKGLETVTLNSSLKQISAHAFDGCESLTSTSSGLIGIGDYAYNDCKKLASISLTTVTAIGEYAFQGCSKLSNVTIPATLTIIKKAAFSNCTSFTTISIPTQVGTIEESAFAGCSAVTTLSIPANLSTAGKACFSGLKKLKSVQLPNGLDVYPEDFFSGSTDLETITMKSTGQTSIGARAFKGTKISTFSVPSTVTTIGQGAFQSTPLTQITIYFTGDKKTTPTATNFGWIFGDNAALRTMPLGNSSIPNSLKKVIFEGNPTSVADYSFYGAQYIEYIGLSETSLTAIGVSAFENCTRLKQIAANNNDLGTIYANVNFPNLETISANAFRFCLYLEKLTLSGVHLKTVGYDAFTGCNNLVILVKRSLSKSLTAATIFRGCKSYSIEEDAGGGTGVTFS